MIKELLNRFCEYVKIDTQANDATNEYPSSKGQWVLGELLTKELREMGISDAHQTKYGLVLGTLESNQDSPSPAIAWIAHMDTSPETSGQNVSPQVWHDYNCQDIILPGDKTKIIRVNENNELLSLKGKTIITSDGTTLLGADNKSGIAVIMQATKTLLANPKIKHGPIRICFTCDEEIGRGVNHLDLKELNAKVAYTLDGAAHSEIDGETFSADLATVHVCGKNIHPSIARGKMINAIRIASKFIDHLPQAHHSPETTEGTEGFLHPYTIEGGVADVTIKILLRDFNSQKLRDYEESLRKIATLVLLDHPGADIKIQIAKQYRNMAEGMAKEPKAIPLAVEAMKKAGLSPKVTSVRGGTDGSRLTELGLPTPNLSTGEHNPHSPLEWTCLEEMETAVNVLVELAQMWASER